jgi:hypothetical protein
VTHGHVTRIDGNKSLILKPDANHICAAARADKARMALISVSLRGAPAADLMQKNPATGKVGGAGWKRVAPLRPMQTYWLAAASA